MMGLIRTFLLVVIAVVATIFVIQNLATIEVAFLTWSIAAPRALVFALLVGMGLVAGYLLHAFRRKPRRKLPEQTAEAANDVENVSLRDNHEKAE